MQVRSLFLCTAKLVIETQQGWAIPPGILLPHAPTQLNNAVCASHQCDCSIHHSALEGSCCPKHLAGGKAARWHMQQLACMLIMIPD